MDHRAYDWLPIAVIAFDASGRETYRNAAAGDLPAGDGRIGGLIQHDGRWYATTYRREPSGLLLVAAREVTAEVATAHALRVLAGGPLAAVEYRVGRAV